TALPPGVGSGAAARVARVAPPPTIRGQATAAWLAAHSDAALTQGIGSTFLPLYRRIDSPNVALARFRLRTSSFLFEGDREACVPGFLWFARHCQACGGAQAAPGPSLDVWHRVSECPS